MPDRTLMILGAAGQLGAEVAIAARDSWQVRPFTRADLDIADATAVRAAIAATRPDAVVNAAAYNHVEACESDPAPAFAINCTAVAALGLACRDIGCHLVHFSTDYVFDGLSDRPYREDDPAHPINLYGLSKLAGEWALQLTGARACILRTCGLYGHHRSPSAKKNFVDQIIDQARAAAPLRVRADLTCTPTSAADLARATLQILDRGLTGTFHATNAGHCTWHEFATEILRLIGLPRDIEPLHPEPIPGKARRPKLSALDTSALKRAGIAIPPWRMALDEYLGTRKKPNV